MNHPILRRPTTTVLAWLSGVSALTTACRPVTTQIQPVGPVTAFVGVSVIPMDQERVLPGQTVLVQGNRIRAIGPVARVRVPAEAVRIDGQGKYLIPGLADMHIHLGANSGDSASAERALFLLLAHGVTTVRNMDYRPKGMGTMGLAGDFLLRLRARAAAGELVSPRIYTSGAWGPRRYIDTRQREGPPPVLDSVAAYVAAYKAAGYDYVKIHDENPVMAESVVAAAHRIGIPVVGHVVGNLNRALAGYASIEHLTGYDATPTTSEHAGASASDEIRAVAAATRRTGVWNCPTLRLAVSEHKTEVQRQATGTEALVRALQEAGAGLLSGTDACASTMLGVPGPSLHQELAVMVSAGLTPYQALLTSTRNAAAYFGTLSESGTIAVGKRADLVLLDGNPLADIHQTARIAGIMRDGRWFSRAALEPRLATALQAVAAAKR